MLKRIWRQVRFFQQLFNIGTPPQPPTNPDEGGKTRRLSDAEYEQLFMQLLDGVNQGWSRGKVQGFLIAKNLTQADLVVWLQRFGEGLQESSQPNQELARRMVRLSQVGYGELGEIAAEIGRDLLTKPARKGGQVADEMEEDLGQESNSPAEIFSRPTPTNLIENADSDDAEAWFQRGNQQFMAEDFLGAVASYDKALQIKPDYHQAWFNRGSALEKLELLEDVITSYDKALQIQPDFQIAWFKRGLALANLGQLEDAITSYDQALQIKSDDHYAWNNRGLALANLGQLEDAITSYDQALQIKSDDHYAWNNRGLTLVQLGQLEDAIASWDKALHFKPDKHEAWYSRGLALVNLGQLEDAIASFDQALQIQPDKREAWYNRGVALANLGQFEEAITSLDKALQIQPDNHDAWINRGIAAGQSLNYNPQATILLQQQFPTSSPVTPNPALSQRGYEGELLCYQEGLKHCPQDTHPDGRGKLHQAMGSAHYFQGKIQSNYWDYVRQRDYWRKAKAEYRQALTTLTPEAYPELHLDVVRDLIRVLFGLGRDAEAKQWRRHSLELFRQLFNSKKTSFQKRQLEVKFISFSQMRVDVLVEDGELVPALEAAERNKNLYLTWIFDAQKEHIL